MKAICTNKPHNATIISKPTTDPQKDDISMIWEDDAAVGCGTRSDLKDIATFEGLLFV